jgi:ketosteroid isomerase-like protein
MRKKILVFFVPFFFISCTNRRPVESKSNVDVKSEMINADKAFSKMSEEKGMKAAFIEYIDSQGVLLRPNSMPLINADAIDFISQGSDTSFSLSWEPRGGLVAKSGELGYTYGTYLLKFKNKDSVQRGTYVSVWRKQANGTWKYVLDSGNDGLSQP